METIESNKSNKSNKSNQSNQLSFSTESSDGLNELDNLNDLQEDKKIYSVGELNKAIKKIIENSFSSIWIKGEISNFKCHTSGHLYFSLKEENAQINAVMFRGLCSRLKFKPQDGMEVIVRGRISIYEVRGSYQIICDVMEPIGIGALQLAFEQLKNKLQKEGLFAKELKKTLPALPKHIAIVTSPTGAAIRDILNVLSRRFKGVLITIIPALVQGDGAPKSIIAAIKKAHKLKNVDVLIVGRGGGSIEDLWAFNDEEVARTIVASSIPVISAVGHEIDFTISDFVADLRAPTPSAAAELVVKNSLELQESILFMKQSLLSNFKKYLMFNKQNMIGFAKRLIDPRKRLQDNLLKLDDLIDRLERSAKKYIANLFLKKQMIFQRIKSPVFQIEKNRQVCDNYFDNLKYYMKNNLSIKKTKFINYTKILDSLSPLKVVERGYSIVTDDNNKIITTTSTLSIGNQLNISFAKGKAKVEIKKIYEI